SFHDFVKNVDDAIDLSNAAWFKVATAVANGNPLQSDQIHHWGAEVKEAIKGATSAYRSLAENLDYHPAVIHAHQGEQTVKERLHNLVHGSDSADERPEGKKKGIFQLLNSLSVMLNQPNHVLLKQAIGQGLIAEHKK